jgi:15-cis-phytoene synthase
MTPDQYCQQRAASSGSSFYYSFLFLPAERRRAITALYAFCREVDDAVDECSDPAIARAKLAWWRSEIAALYSGSPSHPVSRALVAAIDRFDLPQTRFQQIIDGMEMDLTQDRYADFASLQKYCFHVAGVVGLLAAEIFGYENPGTLRYAEDLGTALQLTNIIRDVGEDARRGRVYLPVDELARFGVPLADVLEARESAGFFNLMRFQIARAESFYARALEALPSGDRRNQRAGLVMAAIYRTLLSEIEADGCHVLTRRTRLTPIRKLWLAWKTWLRA